MDEADAEILEMPRYKCHKEVDALKIIRVIRHIGRATLVFEPPHTSIEVDLDYLHKHNPQVGGYYVRYDDGYRSFSPAKAFEEGYTLIE